MKPNYIHDCNACIFLGKSNKFDFYVCLNDNKYPVDIETNYFNISILARYSDEGPDYTSGILFAKKTCGINDYDDPLVRCLSLAIEQGYIIKPSWFKK